VNIPWNIPAPPCSVWRHTLQLECNAGSFQAYSFGCAPSKPCDMPRVLDCRISQMLCCLMQHGDAAHSRHSLASAVCHRHPVHAQGAVGGAGAACGRRRRGPQHVHHPRCQRGWRGSWTAPDSSQSCRQLSPPPAHWAAPPGLACQTWRRCLMGGWWRRLATTL